ncbi:MAG: S8 family serine peptidase [Anaerolineaceae bacterium]|nr:S8 family serine peptidase [Anaerolineaceae bacterium]
MVEKDPATKHINPAAGGASGCGSYALFGAAVLWILVLSIFSLIIQWTVEQAIFEGSLSVPDVRWLVSSGYGMALLASFGALAFAVKNVKYRVIYRAIAAASFFALLQFPVKFLGVTNTQGAVALQIGLMLFFNASIWFFGRKQKLKEIENNRRTRGGWGAAALAGAVLIFPWALWGALGSVLDTVLALAAGLLLGASFWQILRFGYRSSGMEFGPGNGKKTLIRDGVFYFSTLLILTAAIAQNGNQWVLPVIVPVTGFGVGVLKYISELSHEEFNGTAAVIYPGLAAAWSLMWVDADELNMLVGVGQGEILEWTGRVVVFSLFLAFSSIIILFLARKKLGNGTRPRVWRYAAGMVLFLALFAGVYRGFGKPGFYGERLFVILNDQADLSNIGSNLSPEEKRIYVYNRLVVQAVESQRSLRRTLNRLGVPYQPYYLVNALEVRGGPLLRLWLENRPEVDRVLDSPILRPLPKTPLPARGQESIPENTPWNLRMIGADIVWEMGIGGEGIVIGQSDSGVQGDHPELADSYRGRRGDQDYNWLDPWNHSTVPVDIGGHGTHTLGTILGNRVGVAPQAEWIGCVNLARNLGNPAEYLECWQFLLAPYPQNGDAFYDGRAELGANILNNSWGCPPVEGCDPGVYTQAVSALKTAGIFVVVSAGNSGYSGCGSIEDPPAIYSQVYSVGAVAQDGSITAFSSLGPVTVDGSDRTKPDLLAPGQDILSAYPGGSYETASGTSMAGPHVAGVVALIWSANPDLIGDVERTTQILNRSAKLYTGYVPACVPDPLALPNNVAGYGVVDASAAVMQALESR